ncbi:MAG: DASS family sodium-coupled anion symporter [Gammaproteobacteria bacterium]
MTAAPVAGIIWRRLIIVALLLGIWFYPVPEGLTQQAWQLFAVFAAAIIAVIINAMSILLAAILALAIVVLTGTLPANEAYAGFGDGFILLIVVAFLVGRAVVNSGLGVRIAYKLIRLFGKSTLGLGYSLVALDAMIAFAFPSNTARAGVLYPITLSLAIGSGSKVEDGTRKKLGAYLMMTSMAGLSISSALWFTAMAANPIGAQLASTQGVEITFVSWLINASVPCLIALVAIPFLLYRIYPPDIKSTPEAPREAEKKLAEMGPLSRDEKITAVVCILMVIGWAVSDSVGIDKTAIAFLGLGVFMLSGIFTLKDMDRSGDALNVLIWFATLYTMSSSLNELGFMSFVGFQLGPLVEGFSWPVVYVILITAYVLIHYFFVSQTAQLLALFGVFMGLGIDAGVPPALIAMMLLFATNFFMVITPQGGSSNVIFAASGYITQGEIYKNGGLVVLMNLLIFLLIGTPWILALN